MVDAYEITDQQIRALQREAGEAGDLDQVALCRLACGDEETASQSEIAAARAKCARVIEASELEATSDEEEDEDEDESGVDSDGDCVRCGHPANNSSGHGTCDARCHSR